MGMAGAAKIGAKKRIKSFFFWDDGPTWIGSKVGHLVAPFALFAKLATRLRNLHCHIALDCPIGIIS